MSITAHISVNVSANVSLAKPDDIFIFAYNNLTTSDTGRLIMTRENLTPIIDFPLTGSVSDSIKFTVTSSSSDQLFSSVPLEFTVTVSILDANTKLLDVLTFNRLYFTA